ncbi:manganese efflux pump [Clostridium massiliodielmoense]|uniref:manganese efflux pump n=1 Tax=Clostridium massiliodielmoense TaxID=1776385 RepID=UPI0004DA0245|nr:manganese efflux pump [Clostridium massiliodielmoense]KEH99404.1 membrane protein [Clostridium botulinum C/D str. BKT12695]
MIQSIILVTSLCIDAFVASFGYGTNKIKIPFSSTTVINVVCSTVLAISLFAGSIVRKFLPENLTIAICFGILFILGSLRLFESLFKSHLRKNDLTTKSFTFKIFDINFNLNLSADEDVLDTSNHRILKPGEAFTLALACSLDGMAIGFGSGLAGVNYFQVVGFSLISDMVAVMLGCFLGRKIAEKIDLNLSWLSGTLLLVLAFMKL